MGMAERSAESADDDRLIELLPLPLPLPAAEVAPAAPEFAAFYRHELPRLVTLAAAIAGSSHAEELAQEALLRAHRDWARVSGLDKPGAWVRRVTINLATSSRRRTSAEARALARVASRRTLDAPAPEVDGFWQLVRRLPPKQAAAVALHYLEDRSLLDIAAALDCTEGTAKAHLHKARQSLARHLSTQEPER
jgi:RNA polymerase sigma-70 factor, ECF subfamily